jgi:phage shock protein PspC (stress-responsive transcriptional regulator)
MSCKEAMSAMLGVVELGGAIPETQREHLRTCARCRELLESMSALESEIDQEPVRAPAVDERRLASEVRSAKARDFVRRAVTAAAIAFTFTFTVAFAAFPRDRFLERGIWLALATGTVIAVVGLVLFYVVAAVLRDRNGNRIYKRLGAGRQLSGVCLGLSEATGVSIVVFRLAFVALLFAKGIGLVLYLLLDLAMPVHPDDRQHLLRFKLRRLWRRRFAHADHDAG